MFSTADENGLPQQSVGAKYYIHLQSLTYYQAFEPERWRGIGFASSTPS